MGRPWDRAGSPRTESVGRQLPGWQNAFAPALTSTLMIASPLRSPAQVHEPGMRRARPPPSSVALARSVAPHSDPVRPTSSLWCLHHCTPALPISASPRPAMACRRLVRACARSSSAFATPASRPSPASATVTCSSCTAPASASCRLFSSNSRPSCGPGASFASSPRLRSTACGVAALGFRRGVSGHNVVCIVFDRGLAMGRSLERFVDARSPSAVAEGEADTAVKPRRFAVLTTGRGADYCVNTYGGYGPMFISMLSDPGEIWDEYFVVDGQFPSLEELQKYDGFVVTGSRHDAHANEEWIEKLCGLLQRIHEMKKKSLCVCFGHQVMSRALGGKTGRASVGWEVGLRDVCLTDAFFSKSYGAGMPSRLKVLQVHRDQVSEIPPGAELLASSERTGIEMFAVGNHILAIQGHPEFFRDVVVDLLEGRLAPMMTKEEIQMSKESLLKAPDQKAWQQLCKGFLKGGKDLYQIDTLVYNS